ncbi:MAG: tetratricopeptide repeat protein [Blastocatellia bacterium]
MMATATLTMPCIALTPMGNLRPGGQSLANRTSVEKQQAKSLWMNSLDLLERANGVDLTRLAHFLNQLATIYEEQSDFANTAKAERLLQRLTKLVERTGIDPEMEALRPVVLRRLGSLYQAQGRYQEAEELLLRALSSAKTVFGKRSQEVAEVKHHLATLHQECGRFDEAAKYYWRALKGYQQSPRAESFESFESSNVASLYHDLSSLERKRGNLAEAEELATQSLEMNMRVQGLTHSTVAAEMVWLADLLTERKKFDDAERLYRGAIGIIEQVYEAEHYEIANTLAKLASLSATQNRMAEAERCLLRAARIKEKLFGVENLEVAQLRNELAELYGLQSRHAEATQLLHSARTVIEKATGPLAL